MTEKDNELLGSPPTVGGRSGNIFLCKPLWALPPDDLDPTSHETLPLLPSSRDSPSPPARLERHLTLSDLIILGIGSTVGSGIFVLCGLIARSYAGPAVSLSWAVSGLAASLSGLCFAELAGRIPVGGSAYAYAYAGLGEGAAVVAAAGLTLEFLACAAAVARSWGDKVTEYLVRQAGVDGAWAGTYLGGGTLYENDGAGEGEAGWFSPPACFLSLVAVLIMLAGVRESKSATAAMTYLKMAVMAFMTIGGLFFFRSENLVPFLPSQFGPAGIMRGATSSFFGYLGFDEICCLSGEAVNPRRDMPRAVLWTLASVTTFYILASLALTGMCPYTDISPTSGFPDAFRYNGAHFAAHVAGVGELLSLPAVAFVTILAQPRLFHALAQDGLLPPSLGRVDARGNLAQGALVSGAAMVLVASLVPFARLDDAIGGGVLLCYAIADTSLLTLRRASPPDDPGRVRLLAAVFNAVAAAAALAARYLWGTSGMGSGLAAALGAGVVLVMVLLARCPEAATFGGERDFFAGEEGGEEESKYFKTPGMPYLPCLAILMNYYLIAQLEPQGLFILFLYLGLVWAWYLMYGLKNSIGNTQGWRRPGAFKTIT